MLTWRTEWLLDGVNSSSSSHPSLLPGLFDLYVYHAVYVCMFGPSDAEEKLVIAFNRPVEGTTANASGNSNSGDGATTTDAAATGGANVNASA